MRIIALFLGLWLLGAGPAAAFDCAGVSLPSSVVICGDPELMRLADERQAAFDEARARLSREQFHELLQDQRRWVRSYATACGVPPDRPPPDPVPAFVKECFRRAGAARIAFIRGYGLPAGNPAVAVAPASAGTRIGPGFDCGKAGQPLALLICTDPELSRVDLRFNQAYWALYQQLGPAGQPELRADDVAFIREVRERCGLPETGGLTAQVRRARECIKAAYEAKRAAWIARLTGAAYEEAVRAPERAIALQRDLGALGFIPAGAIDGVYGRSTRAGIAAWQSTRGRPVTGLLGDADARAIEQEIAARQERPAAALPQVPPLAERPYRMEGPPAQRQEGGNEIALTRSNGVYTVPARINDAITLDFMVDSGASDVLIPADVFLTLVRTHTISKADLLGPATYRLADGSEGKSLRFRIRKLSVGPYSLANVTANIGPVRAGLLLGQSFLSRFSTWTVNNARHALVLGEQLR